MCKYNQECMPLSKDDTAITTKEEEKNINCMEYFFKLSQEDKEDISKNLLLATSTKDYSNIR